LKISTRHIKRVLFFLTLALGTATYAATTYAYIELLDGPVKIINVKGQSRIPHLDDTIEEGDTIVTGPNGELHARTEDHGFIAVRPNTKMKIDTYSANGDEADKNFISLIVGGFRSVSGWIGKFHRQNYEIRTRTATIGIRGTDHEPFVIAMAGPDERQVGEAGTYEKVNSGSTVISNQAGQTVVTPDHVAFAPHDGKGIPRAVESVPEFYRPTKHEKRIEERKIELAKHVDEAHTEKSAHTKQHKKAILKPPLRHGHVGVK
jgi:hypothetical protein